ncbi:MAG: homoserine/homoserine lactone efflux protein [Proteobacteria bacterium]|nr:homoserine/homoserine lactone efflux protein [Pseudomonadota bacterium]RTL42853.1 MAG: homoserine/homoserine lactone efflux protein [Rhodocyclaceae bacterium]
MALHLWLGFFLTTLVVALSPGPGAVLSMSVGIRLGYRHALKAILGLQTALLLQLALVGLGLGAVLAASELAFLVIKLAGAAYLVWLGVQRWREPLAIGEAGADVNRGFYRQGILVNLGNPKAIVFIAALVPQFIDPQAPQLPQFAVIALTMCSLDTAVMSCYALLASRFRGVLASPRRGLFANRVFGSIFVAAGALLAGTSRQ